MSEQHRRNLNVIPRIISEAEGTVEYVASDATLDSYQESILTTGWRFDLFAKNAPFVNSHNYWSIEDLLGKVTSARIESNQLVQRVQWAKDVAEAKLAIFGWKMTLGGFLKAVSVGFRAIKQAFPSDTGWSTYVAQAGLSPEDAAKCRRIFIEQQQLELSACILGANPSAVAKAYKEGCIRDEDLAGVGFQDDDMHFLTVAGAAADSGTMDPVMQLIVSREMGRITARRQKTPSTPSSGKPGGDDEVLRQAAERADFLRKFQALVK